MRRRRGGDGWRGERQLALPEGLRLSARVPRLSPPPALTRAAEAVLAPVDAVTDAVGGTYRASCRRVGAVHGSTYGPWAVLLRRWSDRSEATARSDRRWQQIQDEAETTVDGSVAYQGIDDMFEQLEIELRLTPRPLWFQLYWLWQDVTREGHALRYRIRRDVLGVRSASPWWHLDHTGTWLCPDCDADGCSLLASDPDHLCTAQVVDLPELSAAVAAGEVGAKEWPDACGRCEQPTDRHRAHPAGH